RFRAFFVPLGLRQDRVPGEADPGPFQVYDYAKLRVVVKTGAVRVFDEHPIAKTVMYNLGDERDLIKGKPPIAPGAPAFLGGNRLAIESVELPASVWFPGGRPDFRRDDVSRLESSLKTAESTLAKARAKAQLDALLARIA